MKKAILAACLITGSMAAAADNEFAGEVLVGSASHEVSNVDFSDSDVSFGLRGVYSFTPNFAVELGYQDFGEVTEGWADAGIDYSNDISVSALNAGLKGSVNVSEEFVLSGRVGFAMWDAEAKTQFDGDTVRSDFDGTDPYLGVGAQYNLSDRMYVGAEYTLYMFEIENEDEDFGTTKTDYDVDNFAVFVGYKF